MTTRILRAVAVWQLFSLLALAQTNAGSPKISPARLDLLTLRSKVFSNTRTIRVWLPPGYDDQAQVTSKYPVFYFTDGVATFHGRHLDVTAQRLISAGKIPPTIFVGIDNGGSTLESKDPSSDRANEYLAYPDEFFEPPLPAPQGKLFPDFLDNEVRPLIESHYRTQDVRGLAGASYGAAIALYTVMERPGAYRWLLLESPSLYIGHDELIHRASRFTQWPERVYVGAGTNEGKGDAKLEMVRDVRRFTRSLGTRVQSCTTIVTGAEHDETAWRARLPSALEFLLGNGSCSSAAGTKRNRRHPLDQ
jgi:enterochelin esterase-like enzyme